MIHFSRVHSSRTQLGALITLVLMFGVGFLVSVISQNSWFYQWQVDKIIHFVSGGALAVLFAPYATRPWVVILSVFLIGVGFEIAEAQFTPMAAYAAAYGSAAWYGIDTTIDVVVDVLGAVLAVKLFFWRFHA